MGKLNLVLILFILPFAATQSTLANTEETAQGKIYGYVFNATRANDGSSSKGEALAGQEVVLYQYIDGKEVDGTRPHTVTDSQGRFEFRGLNVGEKFGYYPVAVYQNIEYYGSPVILTTDTLQKRSDVMVYETTLSDSTISVATHHVIIRPGKGVLNVREFYFFTNRGKRTYIGSVPAGTSGKNVVLQIDLPDNAQELQFGGDLMSCCAVITGNHIFDTMEFKPGRRQIVLNYLLPYTGKELSFSKSIAHPISTMDIFLPVGAGNLNAEGFTAQAPFQIRGETYQRYYAVNLKKGSTFNIMITELPSAPRNWRWVAPLALVSIILIASILLHRYKKSNLEISRKLEVLQQPDVQNERERLLNEILQLDEAYEAGALDEAAYQNIREKLIQLVLELKN